MIPTVNLDKLYRLFKSEQTFYNMSNKLHLRGVTILLETKENTMLSLSVYDIFQNQDGACIILKSLPSLLQEKP